MKRTSLFVTTAFLAGLAIGYFARGAIGAIPYKDSRSADLAAIEKLHRARTVYADARPEVLDYALVRGRYQPRIPRSAGSWNKRHRGCLREVSG